MQIVAEQRDIETEGLSNVRSATIKAGAHMTAVLAGLYKNPVDAMVREYLSNMYDAWVALKKINPNATYKNAELHLPSQLSPYLSFVDYGIGMSFETMIENFFSYGNSTKNGNDDEVGGFGLGSKTGFAYGNGQQWQIISRWNGKEITVIAFIGQNGVQQYTDVMEVDTTERNGITIRIPIQKQDIGLVHDAARKYVPYFPLGLDVINTTEKYIKPSYMMTGDGWGVATRETSQQGVTVVMGNVPYKIDFNQSAFQPVNRHFFTANCIMLDVPIGSVDIVPSRDDLKYTPRTVQTLTDLSVKVIAGVADYISQSIANAKNEWDAQSLVRSFTKLAYANQFFDKVTYKGKVIDPAVGIVRTEAELQTIDASASMAGYGIMSYSASTPQNMPSLFVKDGENHFIMIDDMTKGGVSVAKGYLNTHFTSRGPTGRKMKYGHKISHIILVKTKLDAAQLSEFFGGYPEDRILFASKESGSVKIISTGVKGNDALYRFDGGKTWGARVNVPATGTVQYYLPLTQNHDMRWRPSIESDRVEKLLKVAKEMGIVMTQLYGIKTADISQFDATEWFNLYDVLHTKITAELAANATNFYVQTYNVSSYENNLAQLLGTMKWTGYGDFAAFFAEWTKVTNARGTPKFPATMELVNRGTVHYGMKSITPPAVNKPANYTTLADLYAGIAKKYPMFAAIIECWNGYYGGRNELNKWIPAIKDYVTKMP